MNMLVAENLSKSYGIRPLFENITLGLEQGKKAALVGLNGSGKTTLLKVLTGEEKPDKGTVTFNNEAIVEYLPQNPSFNKGFTVMEQIFHDSPPELRLIRDYEDTADCLSRDSDNSELHDRLHRLTRELDRKNLWSIEAEAKSVLNRLGISSYSSKMGELSGGQVKRVALARALIRPANFLILDEPTNHLDSQTIDWLEKYLARKKITLLVVTHDRYFLDRVTEVIFELSAGQLYRYEGNFTHYLKEKEEREEAAFQINEKRKKILKKELEWLKSGVKARGTKQKARIERFHEMNKKVDFSGEKELSMDFKHKRLGKKILGLEKVSKSYDKKVIRNFSYKFSGRDRIGIIGKNGTGKTTFLRLLNGDIVPDSGNISRGETLRIGYFRQQEEEMDPEKTLLSYVEGNKRYITGKDGEIVTAAALLERFLFPRSRHRQKIKTLSGGERRRLYLLNILMDAPNVLLLDEPTNDLDLDTLMVLEEYLQQFPGVLVAVSHDRYFLNKVVHQVFEFCPEGRINRYPGNYDDYLKYKEEEKRACAGIQQEKKAAGQGRKREKRNRLTYLEQQEYRSIEQEIEKLEEEIKQKESECLEYATDYDALQEINSRKEFLEEQLEEKISRWTYLAQKAEEGSK